MRRPVTILFHDRSRRDPPKEPGALESLLKTLGGIAGAGAVFSALLSVFGFLLLRSHSNLLGLSNFLDHSVTDYLYAGAAFAGYSFYSVVELFIRNVWVLLIAAVIFFAVRGLASRFRRKARADEAEKRVAVARKAAAWACLLLAVLFVIYFMYESLPQAQAQDLLFSSGSDTERMKRTDANLSDMEASYLNGLRYFILSCTVLWATYLVPRLVGAGELPQNAKDDRSASGRRLSLPAQAGAGHALIAAQAILTLLVVAQLLMLPVTYGQTVYSNKFHKVSTRESVMDDSLKARIPDSDKVWLINEGSDYFILYYRDEYMIRLIKKDELKNLSLEGRENIFNR